MANSEPLSDPYGDDAMLPGEYVGLPGMTPEEVQAEKARWKAIAAELDRTRTGPKRTLGELLAAKPGDPLFEEKCRVFDWKD
jgi:hypothetical protein